MLNEALLFAAGSGFATLALVQIQFRRRERLWETRFSELSKRIEGLLSENLKQRGAMNKFVAERDRNVETALRQMQADMKLVEMSKRSSERDAPETVEMAIHLARSGESRDQIIRKTGLSADIIETIAALHAGRARH
jgi:uncharacterized membrane protein YccC